MKIRIRTLGLLSVIAVALTGCVTSPHAAVFESGSQLEARSYQSRVFDTADRRQTLRTVIAALQDLGFVIDDADATLGTVSATKLDIYALSVTATVRARGESQTVVRLNATRGLSAVKDPVPYQDFFAVLEKAMFLTAHQVD